MDTVLGKILCSQSPALFLAAIAFLISYIIRHKSHKIRAALSLIFFFLCIIAGVALYFVGMYWDWFTIHDFWKLSISGVVGLVIVAIIAVLCLASNIKAWLQKRKIAKMEANHQAELEQAKSIAYESGKADAKAAEQVAETVESAVSEATSDNVSDPISLVLPEDDSKTDAPQ